MRPLEKGLLGLAEAVADGAAIDWAEVETTAGNPSDRGIVAQLRLLAQLGGTVGAVPATWGSLEIRAELASGTFGTVYRAWDPRLEREVALKLLHPRRSVGALPSAVVAEGRLIAKIRHVNVVTVYGADVCDGRIGIWMEFVNGRTLREIVTEHGPFGPHEAALIARDLCRALAAVHQLGFVHRDVKAQNVMREAGGRTVLMDFGAGEALQHDGRVTEMRGTPAYLAPELFDGAPATVVSDIYGVGVLLYFLVTGQFPIVGSSIAELRERHAKGQRIFLLDARPDLSPEFVRVVDACTAAEPGARPQSAGAVEALLDAALGLREDGATHASGARRRLWLPAVAVVLALTVASVGWRLQRQSLSGSASLARRDSVAILPFKNLGAHAVNEYFSEGIAADVIADLAALGDLRVIAGASTRQYRDRSVTPAEIRAELGVATMLDTTVRESGDRVRIVSQLVDTRSGEQIWSHSFDSARADIVAMKSDVSNQIAVALRGQLSQRDMEMLRPGAHHNADAFNLYLAGRHYWGLRTEESLNRSIQYFNDAIAKAPEFAPAYAGLSDAYTALGVYGGIPREEAYARAAVAAEKAVALEPLLAEAHGSLGLVHKNRFEWGAAEASFRRALELKPGLATAHHWYSVFLTQQGRFAEAMAEIKLAMSLDPLSVAPRLQLASVLTMARRYDDAIAQYEQALDMDRGFVAAYRHLATVYVHKREYAKASELYEQARRNSPIGSEDQELKADRGYLYARWGRRSEATALARDLIRRYETAHEEVAGSIAKIYAGMDDRRQSLAWLRRAYERHDAETGYLLVDPRWDRLRGDAQFTDLLRALGFTSQR
jgi:TolB-like protein/Tfp pilus assembly protein PilF